MRAHKLEAVEDIYDFCLLWAGLSYKQTGCRLRVRLAYRIREREYNNAC